MKEYEIKEGDIVELDYITEFTKEHINEGKALVMWKGFNHQPLIHKLSTKNAVWTCYEYIARVIGHVDIEKYMEDAIALECESCTDAISREEALEAFKPRGISQDAWEESNVYKTIKALPAVPQSRTGDWIPAEKDNPKTDGRYIVTARVFGAYDPDHKGPYTDEVGESVFRKGKWPITFNYLPCKIIAWQPLPERYNAESEE